MKKTLSILLAVVLMFALALPVFAEDNVADASGGAGSADQAVTATYQEGTESTDVATVYYVTVAWNVDSTLTYYDGTTTYTWNAEETKYVANKPTDNGWTGDATVKITVTNKSNADVKAEAAWADAAGIKAACTFDEATKTIESAAKDVTVADGETGAAKTITITANVDTPSEGTISENNATVGTITVNIAKVA